MNCHLAMLTSAVDGLAATLFTYLGNQTASTDNPSCHMDPNVADYVPEAPVVPDATMIPDQQCAPDDGVLRTMEATAAPDYICPESFFLKLQATIAHQRSSAELANLVGTWENLEDNSIFRPATPNLAREAACIALATSSQGAQEATHYTKEQSVVPVAENNPMLVVVCWKGALCMDDLMGSFSAHGNHEETDWYREDGLNVVPLRCGSSAVVALMQQAQPHSIKSARSKQIRVFVD